MQENSRLQAFFTKKRNIILCAVICTLLWGSAFPSIKIGYELFSIQESGAFTKLVYAGYRFLGAGVMTLLISLLLNKKLSFTPRNATPVMLALALVQTFLQYIFYHIGLANTTGVTGSVISGCSTIFTVLLAHFFCKGEKLTPRKAAGCIIGFAGVFLVTLSSGKLEFSFSMLGEGFLMLSCLFFAMGNIISKRLPGDADSTLVTGWQLAIGGALLLLVGYLGGGSLDHITFPGILVLIYSSFISAAAFTLWLFLMRYNSAGKVVIYNFLTPIFGTVLSGLFLHEAFLTWNNALALLCVCLGIYFVNSMSKKAALSAEEAPSAHTEEAPQDEQQ